MITGDDENGKAGPSTSPSKSPSVSPVKKTESPQKEESVKQPIEDDDEDEEIPASPADVKESIKQKFLVDMPDDFYDFWEFAKSVNAKKPAGKITDFEQFTARVTYAILFM